MVLEAVSPAEAVMLRLHMREWLSSQSQAETTYSRPLRPSQVTPPGDWRTWLILAGRGWGKTLAGAEDVKHYGLAHPGVRIAIVARTFADARDTCVEGESGLLSCLPPSAVVNWNRSMGELILTNGTRYKLFSADEPNRLRGPQHHRAWSDEPASWGMGTKDTQWPPAWDMLQFGLRLGDDPRNVATTTPRPTKLIRHLLSDVQTHVTRGSTAENAANLAPAFLDQIVARYAGTRLGRQELDAEVLDDVPGALWTYALLEDRRAAPDLTRVVVAIDPAVTSGEDSDETGMVVAGLGVDGRGYVLADRSCRLSPDGWAKRAVQAYDDHAADLVVAEVNNGGDMVEHTIKTIRPRIPYKKIHASRGKQTRAQPVAALYEQCIREGTLITTEYGLVTIQDVEPGMRVWTRKGLRRVTWAGQTGLGDTLQITAGEYSFACTPNHPVYVVGRGFVHASTVVPNSDIMLAWDNYTDALIVRRRLRDLTRGVDHAVREGVGPRLGNRNAHSRSSTTFATSSSRMATGARVGMPEGNSSIGRSGNPYAVLSDPIRMSTTSTVTSPITDSRTWSRSRRMTISPNTPDFPMLPRSVSGSPPINASGGCAESHRFIPVMSAGRHSLAEGCGCDSAPRDVTRPIGIDSVERGPFGRLFDLSVEGEPEFFAGGLLVHNCRVSHTEVFPELEEQLTTWTPESGTSPDRLDALVWALTELLVDPEPVVLGGVAQGRARDSRLAR